MFLLDSAVTINHKILHTKQKAAQFLRDMLKNNAMHYNNLLGTGFLKA